MGWERSLEEVSAWVGLPAGDATSVLVEFPCWHVRIHLYAGLCAATVASLHDYVW